MDRDTMRALLADRGRFFGPDPLADYEELTCEQRETVAWEVIADLYRDNQNRTRRNSAESWRVNNAIRNFVAQQIQDPERGNKKITWDEVMKHLPSEGIVNEKSVIEKHLPTGGLAELMKLVKTQLHRYPPLPSATLLP